MLRNYLKITLRALRKQKVFAFINVVGLAVGIAFCALIYLFVRDELTYDRFHEKADRIHRVVVARFEVDGSVESTFAWQPFPLAAAMEADLPEVEETVRLFDDLYFVRQGTEAARRQILFADPALFDVFSFPLLRGDPATVLDRLDGIVLSEAAARRHFGDEDPVGRTLEVRLDQAFEEVVVTGIAAAVQGNSSIRFDYLMPFDRLPASLGWIARRVDNWNASSFYVYALLREDASPAALQAKLPAFRETYYAESDAAARAEGYWTGEGPPRAFRLQPLTSIHLDPSVIGGLTPASDPRYAYILGGIALLILLIACINFTTLAVGRSASRAREVGVRKAVGAQRRQLAFQFWSEAVLMSLLALGLGVALAELFLPVFNTLSGKSLSFDYFGSGLTPVVLLGLALGAGLLAGSYPAAVLSGLRPIDTLRRHARLGGGGRFAQGLVVFQFGVSVVLLVGTLAMLRQLDYLQRRNLGFDEDQVVVVATNGVDGETAAARLRQALGGRADVLGVSAVSLSFTDGFDRRGWLYRGREEKTTYAYRIEPGFIDLMQMELVAGRGFDPARPSDSTGAVVVNEAFVRDMGWTEPVGQIVEGFENDPTVVGVVKDFHFRPLHEAVEPVVLTMNPRSSLRYVLVRAAPGDLGGTLAAVRGAWETIAPDVPFSYSFLDDDLARQYEAEERWSRIVGYAALFAILIACLGLFGLAALNVAGRTKEIGIRKVLGASVGSVTVLLSRDFARLVALAFVLAAPPAYLGVRRWLDGFAYRIDLSWQIFAFAGLAALLVALATVSIQAVRAALADPVTSLRYE